MNESPPSSDTTSPGRRPPAGQQQLVSECAATRLCQLPHELLQRLWRQLDCSGQWRPLSVALLNYSQEEIEFLEYRERHDYSPGQHVLQQWRQQDPLVDELFVALSRQRFYRAMQLLLPYVSQRLHVLLERGEGSKASLLAAARQTAARQLPDSTTNSSSATVDGGAAGGAAAGGAAAGGAGTVNPRAIRQHWVGVSESVATVPPGVVSVRSEVARSRQGATLHGDSVSPIGGHSTGLFAAGAAAAVVYPVAAPITVSANRRLAGQSLLPLAAGAVPPAAGGVDRHADHLLTGNLQHNVRKSEMITKLGSGQLTQLLDQCLSVSSPQHAPAASPALQLLPSASCNLTAASSGGSGGRAVAGDEAGGGRDRRPGHEPVVSMPLMLANIPHVDYDELAVGAGHWSADRLLGVGGFGTVYRASWKNTVWAVKRVLVRGGEQQRRPLLAGGGCGERECERAALAATISSTLAELRLLNACRHVNILPVCGYSVDGPEPLLLYQLMANGSLLDRLLLKGGSEPLGWRQRLVVACGTARALQFLHTRAATPLVHGDVKSANILLDRHWEPRLGDFGLARELPPCRHTATGCTVSRIHGTRPYLPDEYLRSRRLSTRVDTYSFGVVLYEVCTGLPAYDDRRVPLPLLRDYVHAHMSPDAGGACCDDGACAAGVTSWSLMDPKWVTSQASAAVAASHGVVSSESVFWQDSEAVRYGRFVFSRLLLLGSRCVAERPRARPDMVSVLKHLEEVAAAAAAAVCGGQAAENLQIDPRRHQQQQQHQRSSLHGRPSSGAAVDTTESQRTVLSTVGVRVTVGGSGGGAGSGGKCGSRWASGTEHTHQGSVAKSGEHVHSTGCQHYQQQQQPFVLCGESVSDASSRPAARRSRVANRTGKKAASSLDTPNISKHNVTVLTGSPQSLLGSSAATAVPVIDVKALDSGSQSITSGSHSITSVPQAVTSDSECFASDDQSVSAGKQCTFQSADQGHLRESIAGSGHSTSHLTSRHCQSVSSDSVTRQLAAAAVSSTVTPQSSVSTGSLRETSRGSAAAPAAAAGDVVTAVAVAGDTAACDSSVIIAVCNTTATATTTGTSTTTAATITTSTCSNFTATATTTASSATTSATFVATASAVDNTLGSGSGHQWHLSAGSAGCSSGTAPVVTDHYVCHSSSCPTAAATAAAAAAAAPLLCRSSSLCRHDCSPSSCSPSSCSSCCRPTDLVPPRCQPSDVTIPLLSALGVEGVGHELNSPRHPPGDGDCAGGGSVSDSSSVDSG